MPAEAYAAVALAWLSTRVIAVVSVDMTPWMLNDIHIYRSWAGLLGSGTFPAGDPTWQYPPGIAPLFMALAALPLDARWGFTLLILLVDAALMGALLLAHHRRDDASWRGLWLWALAGLVVGPIMMVRFDTVPTLFAALAVLTVARPLRSGALAGIGALTKVWPALMLLALPRKSLPRGLAALVATALVGLAGFALLTTGSLSFLGNQGARGLQIESVGALPYVLWAAFGGPVAYGYEYGSIQVQMAGTEIVGPVVSGVGLLAFAGLVWGRFSGRLESALPGDVALAVLLVSLATSRVNSPQYNVWLIGLAAVALLARRSRMGLVVGLIIVMSVLTQIVYPWTATQLSTGDRITAVIQAARILLLLAATVVALVRIFRASSPEVTAS